MSDGTITFNPFLGPFSWLLKRQVLISTQLSTPWGLSLDLQRFFLLSYVSLPQDCHLVSVTLITSDFELHVSNLASLLRLAWVGVTAVTWDRHFFQEYLSFENCCLLLFCLFYLRQKGKEFPNFPSWPEAEICSLNFYNSGDCFC